jgi:uncharacterized protein (DUF1697 family)
MRSVPRYVAFLRGINLGSINKVSMPRLRELAEGLGYTDVVTYINSGNLILTATDPAATIEERLHRAIADELGLKVDVAVRTPARLATIVAENPFPDGDPSQVTVAFLTRAAPAEAKRKVAARATEDEPYVFSGQEVYVHYKQGIGRSKLSAKFSDLVGVSATVRNLRTVTKVLDLAAED